MKDPAGRLTFWVRLYESGRPLPIESARSIFYKVTGKGRSTQFRFPAAARATIQHAGLVDDPNGFNAGVKDEFDLDSDIAGGKRQWSSPRIDCYRGFR